MRNGITQARAQAGHKFADCLFIATWRIGPICDARAIIFYRRAGMARDHMHMELRHVIAKHKCIHMVGAQHTTQIAAQAAQPQADFLGLAVGQIANVAGMAACFAGCCSTMSRWRRRPASATTSAWSSFTKARLMNSIAQRVGRSVLPPPTAH